MDIIAHNPYRILGVFANDPVKVRTANIARIRAFNKVGKECPFDSDFIDIFGPINRTEEEIEKAITLLSSNSDAEFYSCMWIHRTDNINTSSKAAIDLIRSSIGGSDKAHCVNVLIGAIYADNIELTADYIIHLFECKDAPEDSIKERILETLGNETTGEFESTPFVWWSRLKERCIKEDGHEDTLNFIAGVFNREALRYLRQIAESNSLKEADNKLPISISHNIGRKVIDVIMETCNLETHEPHAEAQIVLSDYAKAVLGACKKYYNSTRFWEAKPVEDLLVILRDIYKISFSSKIKEECSSFGKKLKSETKFLAPQIVKPSSDAIRKEIESFCGKPNEARWSLVLLRNCVEPLIEIKKTLGIENSYYLHISAQIADNAIFACQAELESAERKFSNIQNDREAAKNNLIRVLKHTAQLLIDIEQLDIEDEKLTRKYVDLDKELRSCKEKYGIHIEQPSPSISLQTNDDIYKTCNDYQSLIEFTRKYPDSIHFKEAIKRIWEIEDNAYPQIGESIPEYRKALLAYKEKYPNSHNDSKLLKKLDELLLGSGTLGTVYEYRTFLRLWPNHPREAIIKGRLDLASFKMCNDLKGFSDYLKNFPNGQYRAEAQKYIQAFHENAAERAFNKCTSLNDFNKFILQYPSSKLYSKALERIEDLIYHQVIANGKYDLYFQRYPKGRYVQTLHQNIDEKCYKQCKTREDYEKYIKNFPKGEFVDEAKFHIKYEKRKKAILILLVLIIIGAFFYSFSGHFRQFIEKNSKGKSTITSTVIASPDESTSIDENEEYEYGDEYEDEYEVEQEEAPSIQNEPISTYNPDDEYRNNSLETGAKPYSQYFGRAQTGDNYFEFKTSGDNDYVVIIKRHRDDKYINHTYIKGKDTARLYVPDGNYDVYFYSGKGWNPNKEVGQFKGGFVQHESMQKDDPVYLESGYLEYTLYPVKNGNLVLQSESIENVFGEAE